MKLVENHIVVNVEANIKKNMLHFEEPYIEERAFFYKIIGDYYRYGAEATTLVDYPKDAPRPTKEDLR